MVVRWDRIQRFGARDLLEFRSVAKYLLMRGCLFCALFDELVAYVPEGTSFGVYADSSPSGIEPVPDMEVSAFLKVIVDIIVAGHALNSMENLVSSWDCDVDCWDNNNVNDGAENRAIDHIVSVMTGLSPGVEAFLTPRSLIGRMDACWGFFRYTFVTDGAFGVMRSRSNLSLLFAVEIFHDCVGVLLSLEKFCVRPSNL